MGALYKHINSRLTHTSRIALLVDYNGENILDDTGRVKLPNEYFVNVGITDDEILPPMQRLHPVEAELSSIYLTAVLLHR